MRERSPKVVADWRLKQPESVDRKLIRASLSGVQEQTDAPNGNHQRQRPPIETHAEEFYYIKQMRVRTPMVVVLESGDVLHGVIEWYDKRCIKLSRIGKPNLLIMKSAIRYVHKEQSGTSGSAVRDGG
jgi:sRNA-binding regulator protein Hfq